MGRDRGLASKQEQAAVDAVVREMTFGQQDDAPPPKALGDLVEALIGAVFVDSGFDEDTTWQVSA